MTTPISGFIKPILSSVRDAFSANFDGDFPELGASFAVMQDGELIVDLYGGYTDRKKETLWAEDTIACVYSTGKAVCAFLIARAVSAGKLDYDAPVANYWPEFAAAGKEKLTVAEALSHQGGLCGFPDEMPPADWLNWETITGKLAAMAPLWPPGSENGYHPQTAGFLAGELIRRVEGRTIGEILRHDYFQPHGIDLHCGVPPEIGARTAFMPKPPRAPDLGDLNEFTKAAFLKPWSSPAKVSREDWMAAELPASNMHGSARSIAQLVHAFACNGDGEGVFALASDVVAEALKARVSGDDLVLPFHLTWAAGLMHNTNGQFGPEERALGHAGFGGSCVVVAPERRLTAAYVMNRMSPYLVGDPRATRLLAALYEGL